MDNKELAPEDDSSPIYFEGQVELLQAICKSYERQTDDQKSRIAELERENGKLRGAVTMASNSVEYRGKLNKKLMGLLEERVKLIYCEYTEETKEQVWQSYCKEHNLKIDTDGK